MEVNCEGCAGCCLDWRPLADDALDHERRGPWEPLDDTYNLVPLTRGDVRDFLAAGLADALAPRLWRATEDPSIEIDGYRLAAVDGDPAFFLGLRTPPKPVAPFDTDPRWLSSCVFLDPETLQCRIHETEEYPTECGVYPGHNLDLDAETECERVEDAVGGDRLVDDSVPEDLPPPQFGPQAIGHTVFVHPDAGRLEGVVERVVADDLDQADRAEFVGAALGGSPGTTATNEAAYREARERASEQSSWASAAIADWRDRANEADADPALGAVIEGDRGAPSTPGWD